MDGVTPAEQPAGTAPEDAPGRPEAEAADPARPEGGEQPSAVPDAERVAAPANQIVVTGSTGVLHEGPVSGGTSYGFVGTLNQTVSPPGDRVTVPASGPGMAERVGGGGRDFFISYTAADRAWAAWIAATLEGAGYTTVLQDWDFGPGGDFIHQMQRATSTAARTIAVLSPAYFGSAFGEAEWRAAFVKDPTGEGGLLVPVRVEPCTPPGLLASRVYIDLVDADEAAARRRLLDGVGRSGARPAGAAYPGGAGTTGAPPPGRGGFPGRGEAPWTA